jgi:hypothetical protein
MIEDTPWWKWLFVLVTLIGAIAAILRPLFLPG